MRSVECLISCVIELLGCRSAESERECLGKVVRNFDTETWKLIESRGGKSEAFLYLILFHQMLPFLHDEELMLRRFGISRLPPETEEFLQSRGDILKRSENIKRLSLEIAHKAESENVRAVFFKGSSLLWSVYKGIEEYRRMADIDLFVRAEDLESAERLLCDLGFCEDYSEKKGSKAESPREHFLKRHYHVVYQKDGIFLELHWAIERDSLATFGDTFCKTARVLEIEEVKLVVPCPEYEMLCLAVNMRQDVVRIIPFDWETGQRDAHVSLFGFLQNLHEMKLLHDHFEQEIDPDRFRRYLSTIRGKQELFLLFSYFHELYPTPFFEAVLSPWRRRALAKLYTRLIREIEVSDLERRINVLALLCRLWRVVNIDGGHGKKAFWIESFINQCEVVIGRT